MNPKDSTDVRRYIGISEEVQVRLQQHNDGVSKWMAKYRPWHLVWISESMHRLDGRKLEITGW